MMRTAVTVVVTAAATLAAVYLSGGFDEAAPASQDSLLERLEGVEESLARLADARAPAKSLSPSAVAPAAREETPEVKGLQEKRESAMRAGNAVIEQVVGAGQFTIEDDIALTAAIGELSGEDQVAVMSRLSMAINEGRVQVRRPGQ